MRQKNCLENTCYLKLGALFWKDQRWQSPLRNSPTLLRGDFGTTMSGHLSFWRDLRGQGRCSVGWMDFDFGRGLEA